MQEVSHSANRSNRSSQFSSKRRQNNQSANNDESDESLRARLADQLEKEAYDCMICCEAVRSMNSIWSCNFCYHIFHLRCVKEWAQRSRPDDGNNSTVGWRCPTCQNVSQQVPKEYRCFCGKYKNPKANQNGYYTPHTCGNTCAKTRGGHCTHK